MNTGFTSNINSNSNPVNSSRFNLQNTNIEPIPLSNPNSPSKSSLYGMGISSNNTQQLSPIHLAETGRRPSGNLSRISFLYNNSFLGNNGNNNNAGSTSINPIQDTTQIPSSFSDTGLWNHSYPHNIHTNTSSGRTYFQASNEILACDRSYETPNLLAIATPRNLQLLKVSSNEISLETELSMKPAGRAKSSTINDLAFGHQLYGRNLAASTITGSIQIYSFDRGTRVKTTLNGHNRAVNSIDFNHITPHMLASGSQDGKILIWDLKSSNTKPVMKLNCNADAVRSVSFNPKRSNVLAAVFDSGVVEKWDLRKTATWEKRINAHTGPALSVHWHPELDYIVTGSRDKQLQVWNLGPGVENRDPAHVINTSGPIFKAKWCKGRGNGSILNTDIAVSFFNDDSCVQIWNLNRKYIPKTIIDGHSAQITQLVWRTPKHLISCSKDKTLIQYDVTREQNFLENIPNGSFAWNPSKKFDFVYIKQEKSQFEGPFTSSRAIPSTDLNTVEEINNSNSENSFNNISNVNSNNNNNTNSQSSLVNQDNSIQFYENTSASHGGSSPTLASTFKQQRQPLPPRQPSYSKIIQKLAPPPAWVTSVHIPLLLNDLEKFKFLSTHYMIRIPNGSDITDVCEYNSILAASVGFFRDSQTWKTIKMAIILEIDTKNDEEIESKLKNFAFDKNNSFSRSDSRLGTSYGSESDIMRNRGSEVSGSYVSADFHAKPFLAREVTDPLKNKMKDDYNENAIIDDDDEVVNQTNEKIENEKEEDVFQTNNAIKEDDTSNKLNETNNSEEKEFKSNSFISPIEIESKIKKNRCESVVRQYRYSFTGSSVDLDDEKSGSPVSLSCSPMLHKSHSRLMMTAKNIGTIPNDDNNSLAIGKSVDTRLSRISDNRSMLTAVLKEAESPSKKIQNEQDNVGHSHQQVKVPWNPEDLIKHAVNYSSQQGDILMCATLSLLFENIYSKAIPHEKAEEYIYMYHESLLRDGYFNNAATVLRIASETHEEFKKRGQTKTSVRTICCNCGKVILNESSKERYKNQVTKEIREGEGGEYKMDFGFWYCDKCSKPRSGCCYCNEPIKGNTVGIVECGHEGHFGCFRSWFIEQGQLECPACGVICVK